MIVGKEKAMSLVGSDKVKLVDIGSLKPKTLSKVFEEIVIEVDTEMDALEIGINGSNQGK